MMPLHNKYQGSMPCDSRQDYCLMISIYKLNPKTSDKKIFEVFIPKIYFLAHLT